MPKRKRRKVGGEEKIIAGIESTGQLYWHFSKGGQIKGNSKRVKELEARMREIYWDAVVAKPGESQKTRNRKAALLDYFNKHPEIPLEERYNLAQLFVKGKLDPMKLKKPQQRGLLGEEK